jgi:hypothetical protein
MVFFAPEASAVGAGVLAVFELEGVTVDFTQSANVWLCLFMVGTIGEGVDLSLVTSFFRSPTLDLRAWFWVSSSFTLVDSVESSLASSSNFWCWCLLKSDLI